jgi:hypothetical protein
MMELILELHMELILEPYDETACGTDLGIGGWN